MKENASINLRRLDSFYTSFGICTVQLFSMRISTGNLNHEEHLETLSTMRASEFVTTSSASKYVVIHSTALYQRRHTWSSRLKDSKVQNTAQYTNVISIKTQYVEKRFQKTNLSKQVMQARYTHAIHDALRQSPLQRHISHK